MISMKEQAFGLELEFGGISRKKAAWAIKKAIDGASDPRWVGGVYDKLTVAGPDGREWTIMRDASVDEQGGQACEFVTPKCTYADIETVQACIRALRRAGAKVNRSCGLHIHIDGANHNAKSLKNLAFTFRAKQDLIFKAVAPYRSTNSYCKPLTDDLVDNIKKIKSLDDEKIKDAWYDTYSDSVYSTDAHYHGSRYHALNYHSLWYRGTVEFRLFNSTLHAGEVRAYINLCLAMSAAAINAKRVSAESLEHANDKQAMRCWLLRMGFGGEEYASVRKHLLKRLGGNTAEQSEPSTNQSNRTNRTNRTNSSNRASASA